jgi:hypothetical protein
VCRLLANPELRANLRRAGQAKAQRYDWPHVATQVLEYYAEIIAQRGEEPAPRAPRFARMRRVAGRLMRV